MSDKPLSGYKVLDLTQIQAGTTCTEILAWFGAEVLKVERPVRGELARHSVAEPNIDRYDFLVQNMNKKSITCNAKSPEGHKLLEELVKKCDVIAENLGSGSMERLGLSYEHCKELNPKIIYASLKGFSQKGPYKDYPSFDPVATHTGIMVSATGLPEQPIKSGISIADNGTGMMLAMGVITALLHRERYGVGQRVDCAMQDFMIALARGQWEPYYERGGVPNRRVGNGMPYEDTAPSDTYPCKPFGINDYVHIFCSHLPGSKHWDNLCDVIGRPDLKEAVCPEMATPHERYIHRDICDGVIREWLTHHDKFEAMDLLCKGDVPAGALLDVGDITRDPQYYERGMMVEIDHPERGKVKVPGCCNTFSAFDIEYKCSPTLGNANEEVYGGLLGLSAEEMAELKEKKVI